LSSTYPFKLPFSQNSNTTTASNPDY
jgi:hypothetical protein